MAQQVKTNLDLNGLAPLNLKIENLSNNPSNPSVGSIYYNTTAKSLYIYDGTNWIAYNPLLTYEFSKQSEGVLRVSKKRLPGVNYSQTDLIIVDTSKFDTKGSAASALTDAKSYTDTKISELVNSAPEELDTLKELADAVKENKDLLSTLEQLVSTGVQKSRVSCPALTPESGVCTWICHHGLTLNSWKNDNTVLCEVYETETNEKVICDIKINSAANVIIKIASTTNINANAYYAVFVG